MALIISTLAIIGVVLVRKSHKADETKTMIVEGIAVNDYYSKVTKEKWGEAPIALQNNPELTNQLWQAVHANLTGGSDAEVELLKQTVVMLLDAYSKGDFETLKNYQLRQSSVVNGDLIALQNMRATDNLTKLRANPFAPLFGAPAKVETPRLVRFDRQAELNLGELYTNRIKLAWINIWMTEAYHQLEQAEIDRTSGEKLATKMSAFISQKMRLADQADSFPIFLSNWEYISSKGPSLSVFYTNSIPNGFSLNSMQLGGVQRDLQGLFEYEHGPDEIIQEQGKVKIAVFQAAVKPRGLDYFGPITTCFFYDAKQAAWKMYQLVCHGHIAPSVPF